MSDYVIRSLKTLEELRAVEALQRLVWDDPTTVIYSHMLISLARNGGSILGALRGDQLIGFIISYLGLEAPESERPAMANLKLVSQRMAVQPEYRGTGVGYELKLAQRDFAIGLGIRLITWTFDPLLSRNAHLNIRKLGAIGQVYYRDYYGSGESALVKLHSSDRLLAEWWVTSNRVEQRINGRRGSLTLQQYLEATLTSSTRRPSMRRGCRFPPSASSRRKARSPSSRYRPITMPSSTATSISPKLGARTAARRLSGC